MTLLDKKQRVYFQEFIREIEKDLYETLESNAVLFPSRRKLLSRFDGASKRLLGGGLKYLGQFIEFHNELCVAASILEEPTCKQLNYESEIEACEKRFGFYITFSSRGPLWVEVKTVHPTNQNDWGKYERDLYLRRFGQVEVILEKEWLGGELYHKTYASRSKILEYVLQTEEKIHSCVKDREEVNTVLTFFSNGFDWHLDMLEDFIFFYRYGNHLPEDTFGTMEDHHIRKNDIKLRRNIDFFAFMERSSAEIRPSRRSWNVRPTTPYEKLLSES